MTLTLQFSAPEEFEAFKAQIVAEALNKESAPVDPGTSNSGTQPPEAKAARAEDALSNPIVPQPTPSGAPEQTTDAQTLSADAEEVRVEARGVLAQLNRKAGKNVASDLIHALGVERLTDVAPADLPELLARAKEALQNAK